MPARSLTGSRIRDRRIALGLKQAVVAAAAGISPSYLNLIEHNRRRIGGRLLNDIARVLGVEATALAEGADVGLLDALREVLAGGQGQAPEEATADPAEADQLEDFASRYPGWARRLTATHARADQAARRADALTDRLAHDPELSASLHEVLSTVTAIHSTATILVETKDIDAEWQTRFQRNLAEESARLTQSAEALVRYLDADKDQAGAAALSPQEEMDAWLAARGHHIAVLERAVKPTPAKAIEEADQPLSTAAQSLLCGHLRRYTAEAEAMPLTEFTQAARDTNCDPRALSETFSAPLAAVLRRLASLPADTFDHAPGLVACDGAGALTLRKATEGFSLPRYGAACPLWPLYQALSRPMTPIRSVLAMDRQTHHRFTALAICEPRPGGGFDAPPVLEATMLILPEALNRAPSIAPPLSPPIPVGPACRICAVPNCAARREPSVMA